MYLVNLSPSPHITLTPLADCLDGWRGMAMALSLLQ